MIRSVAPLNPLRRTVIAEMSDQSRLWVRKRPRNPMPFWSTTRYMRRPSIADTKATAPTPIVTTRTSVFGEAYRLMATTPQTNNIMTVGCHDGTRQTRGALGSVGSTKRGGMPRAYGSAHADGRITPGCAR